MPIANFTLRQARGVQAMLDEVNLAPPALIAVGGASALSPELADAIAGEARQAVEVKTGQTEPAELEEFTAFAAVIDEWPLAAGTLQQLRAADRAEVPIVAALIDFEEVPRSDEIPYVLATDVVRARDAASAAVPVMERVAAQAKGDAYVIARAMPQYRDLAARAIINHYARLNGLVSAAALVPLADLPVLTINQLRMVARLAGAHGIELDAKRLLEFSFVVGAGLGFRGVLRSARNFLPGPRWAMNGGVAMGGTVAIGEAALRRFRAETTGTL